MPLDGEDLPPRLECDNWEVLLDGGGGSQHPITVSVARDPFGHPLEVVFVGRGKSGHGIDLMFADLGVKLSKILQGRDPEGGAEDGPASPFPLLEGPTP